MWLWLGLISQALRIKRRCCKMIPAVATKYAIIKFHLQPRTLMPERQPHTLARVGLSSIFCTYRRFIQNTRMLYSKFRYNVALRIYKCIMTPFTTDFRCHGDIELRRLPSTFRGFNKYLAAKNRYAYAFRLRYCLALLRRYPLPPLRGISASNFTLRHESLFSSKKAR